MAVRQLDTGAQAPQISFIAHELYQRLATNGAEEIEQMGRVTKLLQETIHNISHGFEEPAMQAEIIPEREAEKPQASTGLLTAVWSITRYKRTLIGRNDPTNI
jgi:hypothetical protein